MGLRRFREILGGLMIAGGVIGGIYVGGWLLLVKPAAEVILAYMDGTLTNPMLGIALAKWISSVFAGYAVYCIGAFIGIVLRL